MENILAVENLHYTYPSGAAALKGISLQVKRGERLAVLGSNGSGKSTLFLCLNGVLRPQQGRLLYLGHPVCYHRSDLIALRKNVGIVFQDADTQLFCINVYQEVAFGPQNLGLRGGALDQVVNETLRSLDLLEWKELPPHYLSGGQKKLVSIASVLSMKPEVLIFDEPSTALDPRHTEELFTLLEQLSGQGMTIILSTHDVDLAYRWADRVLILSQGEIVAEGEPVRVLSEEHILKRSGLRPPLVPRIFQMLVCRGILPGGLAPPRSAAELENYLEAIER